MAANKSQFRIIDQVEGNPEHTLVIVGTALDGPTHTPFVLSIDDPVEVLGSCPLSDAYIAAKDAGAGDIILYRINGEHAEATVRAIMNENESYEVLKLRMVSAGEIYNDANVTLYPTHLYFHETEYRAERAYFFDRFTSLYDLVYKINQDAEFGLIECTAEIINPTFDIQSFNLIGSATAVDFAGGISDDQMIFDRSAFQPSTNITAPIREELKKALFGPFEEDYAQLASNSPLAVMDFGVILLADLLHTDDPEYSKLLAQFCQIKSVDYGQSCIGVIGAHVLTDTSDESVDAMKETLLSASEVEAYQEYRAYLQVIVGQTRDYINVKQLPAAYAYAGAQASYPYHIMMTNKQISGIRALEYKLTKEDVDSLTANGYTCIVASIRRGNVAYSATTYVRDAKSIFRKPHCIRISHNVSKSLSENLDYLIGNIADPITRKEVVDRVNEHMSEFVTKGIIASYTAQCQFLDYNRELKVDVDIQPFSEIRTVNTGVTLTVPGGVIR